jgi:hypothetical protein
VWLEIALAVHFCKKKGGDKEDYCVLVLRRHLTTSLLNAQLIPDNRPLKDAHTQTRTVYSAADRDDVYNYDDNDY